MAAAPKYATSGRTGPALSDQQFFDALDLGRPDLAAVKALASKSDWPAAKHAFVEHIKTRATPQWTFDWKQREKTKPRANLKDADRYARNMLQSCGVWEDFKDEIDWNANPMPNQYAEWTWQLSRHPFWVRLGEAYWATGDEKYAKAFVAQMSDWVRKQPVPDDSGNYAYSAWRTIETGIRMFGAWPDSFYYFLSSPSFDDEAIIMMVKSFYDHAEHLMKFPTSGNWLAMEGNGLFHAGALFPEYKRSATWRQTALDRLYAELDAQVYPDGAQIELASGYHNVSLGSFEQPVALAQRNGLPLPPDFISKMQRMFDYDLFISMPNRRMPPMNDSDAANIIPWMEKGARYFPERRDFQWAATDGKEGAPPQKLSCDFPYAGYYVMRSGWDADARYLLLDAGPFGYGHQHEDKLTLVAAAYGRVHLIDPGNYAYDSSQWRRYHIDTFAHNTVLVDGQPQRRRGARDRSEYVVKQPLPHTWVTAPAADYAAGVYDEGYGTRENRCAVHRRQVVYVKSTSKTHAPGEYWVVIDSLEPKDAKTHSYDAMFHLDADAVEIDAASLVALTRNRSGSNFAIVPVCGGGLSVTNQAGQEKPYVQGWVKAGAYEVKPLPTPVYHRDAAGPALFVFVLYPLRAGEALPVTGVRCPQPNTLEIAFGARGTDRLVLSSDEQAPVRINEP